MPASSGDGNALRLLCTGAMSVIVGHLAREFERATGIRVSAEFTRSGVVRDRIRDGEVFDVAISTQPAIDELARGGQVHRETVVASSGIGVAVRAGHVKPDIGSVSAFIRVLRDAKSIAYADPASGSPSANYLVGLFSRLRLTEELKPKTHLVGASGGHAVVVCDCVASGEAEIGIQQIAEIVPVAGVDFVGPLPDEIQHMTVFSAAVVSTASHPDLARRFVEFISSAAAKPAIVANGMEPG
jgi:molybdate transport system substrate-binding protein